MPEKFDLSGSGHRQSGQQFEGGGFSGTVGTDKAIDFSFGHLHVQMVHGSFAAVLFAQAHRSHSDLHGILSFDWYGFILSVKGQTIAKEL